MATSEKTVSQDAFHNGSFLALQPKQRGNRSGMDALLLAASVPRDISGLIADLGSGAGVAGLALLNRNDALDLLCVERNPEMADLARQSRLLAENSHLRERVQVIEADVTLSGLQRQKTGLNDASVDHVMMNPPYNNPNMRAPREEMRHEAFVMGEGGLDAWFRTASAITRNCGTLTMIYRSESLGEVIACAKGRFGAIEIIPVHSRALEPAKRMIIRAIRGSKAPLSILPGFVVHTENGDFTPHADAIFKGTADIFGL